MRTLIASLTVLSAACPGDAVPTGSRTGELLGGSTIMGASYDPVCGIYVVLPLDDDDMPQDPIWCAGVHVADSMLLTAASCVEENLTAGTLADVEVRCGADATELFAVTEVKLHRYYTRLGGDNDLALLRLDGDPTGALATLNERALTDADLGPSDPAACTGLGVAGCTALIGYGESDNGADDPGVRQGLLVPLRAVEDRHVLAGTPTATTCRGDTGAPVFMDLGVGPVVVAITASQRNSCDVAVARTRVDVYLDDFIHPYLDRFGATCGLDTTCETTGCPRTPDPDCDPCAWNDTCEEACPTRDWDCPLGSFVGDACADSGDCEEGGSCLTAHDDPAYLYCGRPCDPAETGGCPAGMLCLAGADGDECTWDPDQPSPGSQGAGCVTALDCRSGICEGRFCVTECDPAAAQPCPDNLFEPDQPYTCQPSTVEPGTNVCVGEVLTGGGGFCAAGGRGGSGWVGLILLAAALLASGKGKGRGKGTARRYAARSRRR